MKKLILGTLTVYGKRILPVTMLAFCSSYLFMFLTPIVGTGVLWLINIEVSLDLFIGIYSALVVFFMMSVYYLVLLILNNFNVESWLKEIYLN